MPTCETRPYNTAVVSPAIADGLKRYEIGPKLRALRLRRKMGLVELGRQTGLSSAMLSKIERGRLFPTLPTLLRVAVAFGIGLEHFFTDTRPRPAVSVVRSHDRVRVPGRMDGRRAPYQLESLDFDVANRRFNAACAEFEASQTDRMDRHSHEGGELVFVLSGRLIVSFEDAEHALDPGDAIYFEANRPHGYRRDSVEPCTALMVTAT